MRRFCAYRQLLFVLLLGLSGCGLNAEPHQLEQTPTTAPSPSATTLATETAVVPTATPSPTAIDTPVPAETAVVPTVTPTSEVQPPALQFQEVTGESQYRQQRVFWEAGFRGRNYCQDGPYRWLNEDHLLLYPIVEKPEGFVGHEMGQVTWPVVASLNGQSAWVVSSPPTDVCDLPLWSEARQQLIEVVDEIYLYNLSGTIVESYPGAGPLHLAPSGQRLLANDQWLDLESGRSVTLPRWEASGFHVPGWTANEMELFACCFNYANVETETGWHDSRFTPLSGRGTWPGEAIYSEAVWLPDDTHALLFAFAVAPRPLIPLIEPAAKQYQDVADLVGIGRIIEETVASPSANHIFLKDAQEMAHLVDLRSFTAVASTTIAHRVGLISWSADGRFLAYVEWDDRERKNGRVWLLDTNGQRQQLTDQPVNLLRWHDTQPIIAMVAQTSLYLHQADTGSERQLAVGQPIDNLAWQPNGEGLVLQKANNSLSWLAQPLQSSTVPLALITSPLDGPIHSLRWSPNGAKLAYVQANSLTVLTLDDSP